MTPDLTIELRKRARLPADTSPATLARRISQVLGVGGHREHIQVDRRSDYFYFDHPSADYYPVPDSRSEEADVTHTNFLINFCSRSVRLTVPVESDNSAGLTVPSQLWIDG